MVHKSGQLPWYIDRTIQNVIDISLDGGEQFPHEVVKRLVDSESPVKVFRQYRDMTQDALAAAAKVSTGYVSQIEHGMRRPSQKVLAAFATFLELNVEDLS